MRVTSIRWIAAALLLATCLGTLTAATITWDGGAGDKVWDNAANWSSDIVPGPEDWVDFRTAGLPADSIVSLGAPQSISLLRNPEWAGTGNFTIGTATDVAAGNTLTLRHFIRGTASGSLWGSMTLAANTVLAADSLWLIQNDGSTYVNGSISGSGIGLAKFGTSQLNLRGANTYDGDTSLRVGTLYLDFNTSWGPTADILNPASTLQSAGGYLQMRARNAATRSQSFDSVVASLGASTVRIESNWDAYARMTFDAIGRNAGATLNLRQPSGRTTISASNGFTTSQANDATGILGGYLTVSPENSDTPADWASNNGANIVAYTGYAVLSGGTPSIADDAGSNVQINNASTGDVTLAAPTVTINTLKASDSAARALSIGAGNTLRLGAVGGLLTSSGTGVLRILGGTLTAGGAPDAVGEVVFVNATAITNSATIADNGAGSVALTKSGSGALVLTTPPTHTGGTFVNAGSLVLPGGVNPLTIAGPLAVNGGVLNFGGGTQTNTSTVDIRGGIVTNGTLAQVGGDFNTEAGTIAATLAGTAGLIKTSPGRLVLNAGPSYTGVTHVREGHVSVTSGTLKNDLYVGLPEGGFPASFSSTTGGAGIPGGRNVTVYPNGSYYQGDWPNINNLTVIGGTVSGNWPNIDGRIYMTGGTVNNGPLTGNNAEVVVSASPQTAVIAADHRWSQYAWGIPTYTVADGAAAVDLKVTGPVMNEHTSWPMRKEGAGVLQFTAAGSSFNASDTQAFQVNAGTVLVDNASGAGLGKSPVTVGGGATLGGRGFIGGVANWTNANVTVAGASGNPAMLAPGTIDASSGSHVVGTLTVGSGTQANNVTMGNYSTLRVTLGTDGTGDRLTINGTLSLATANDTLDLFVPEGAKPGTYVLASATGGITGTFDTVTGKPSGASLFYNTLDKTLELTIPEKGTVLLLR